MLKRFWNRARKAEGAPRTSRARTGLRLEALESRELLIGPGDYVLSGYSWANPGQITYSIPADGTPWDGGTDNLNASMNAEYPDGSWVRQFAKALQTWASVANINVVPVPDGSDPFNTFGAAAGRPPVRRRPGRRLQLRQRDGPGPVVQPAAQRPDGRRGRRGQHRLQLGPDAAVRLLQRDAPRDGPGAGHRRDDRPDGGDEPDLRRPPDPPRPGRRRRHPGDLRPEDRRPAPVARPGDVGRARRSTSRPCSPRSAPARRRRPSAGSRSTRSATPNTSP